MISLWGLSYFHLYKFHYKEETITVTKKIIRVIFGILVIAVWVIGASIPAQAETLNYKFYTWMVKSEPNLVGDVEGHIVSSSVRNNFWVFENGEIATTVNINLSDLIKGSGPLTQYITVKFADGSTIMMKSQGVMEGSASGDTYIAVGKKSEIIKGTGRFAGIKGTQASKTKYLSLEKGELGPKGYGEGTITYTLPGK